MTAPASEVETAPIPGADADDPAPPVSSTEHAAPEPSVVLDARGLRTYFFSYEGVVRALDGVSFQLRRGETLGLVGETGCGKSVTALTLTRLVPDPPGRIVAGHLWLGEADLLEGLAGEAKFRPIPGTFRVRVSRRYSRIRHANARMEGVRGRRIAMIFQEPSQALNPVFSIANQVGEILFLHHGRAILDEMLATSQALAPRHPADRPTGAARAVPSPGPAGAPPTLERPREHRHRRMYAPAVEQAIAEVLARAGGPPPELRDAADRLGATVGSGRLATEAFYLLSGETGRVRAEERLREAVGRLRLSGFGRHYLAHRRREIELREAAYERHLHEMQGRAASRGEGLGAAVAGLRERLRGAVFGLWGLRRWVRRPLDRELFWRVVVRLEGVRIANPVRVAQGYPHELSGGMLQRVMIAMALSGEPEVLLADEPTTALDVTIQAQILDLLAALRRRVGTAVLLITHDLAVVAEVADRVCVMYAGRIAEQAPVGELFRRPLHPYTQGLLASVPRIDRPDKSLHAIPGSVPNLIDPPTGCRFHPRCPHAMPVCKGEPPPTTDEGDGHTVACYLYHGRRVGD